MTNMNYAAEEHVQQTYLPYSHVFWKRYCQFRRDVNLNLPRVGQHRSTLRSRDLIFSEIDLHAQTLENRVKPACVTELLKTSFLLFYSSQKPFFEAYRSLQKLTK